MALNNVMFCPFPQSICGWTGSLVFVLQGQATRIRVINESAVIKCSNLYKCIYGTSSVRFQPVNCLVNT